jgi:hypothetical protein
VTCQVDTEIDEIAPLDEMASHCRRNTAQSKAALKVTTNRSDVGHLGVVKISCRGGRTAR